MTPTSFEEFKRLAERSTFVPVCKELMADLLTPASAFLKIAEHSDYAFLFESVEGGEHVGRYSFLGKDPFLVLRARAGRTMVEHAGVTTETDDGVIDALRDLMKAYQSPFVPGLPRFIGGAVGYLTYEAAARIGASLGVRRAPAGSGDDEAGFMLFDTVLAFDHVRHRILVIANARVSEDDDLEALYQFACAKIEFLERELQRPLSEGARVGAQRVDVRSNMSRAQFEQLVRAARDCVRHGNVHQVVVSQRFDGNVEADPFTVYRALRHVSPSPYMYFIRMGERSIVGSSPEMLVRVEGGRVETHPMTGTRPRGDTEEDDRRQAEELKRSENERAAHARLVDQAREDLVRVCDPSSVKASTFMALERYSHVMHLASAVDGRLEEGRDRLDALVACCPAATVSGTPKHQAIAALAELEPMPRGVFSGAVGYVDCAGNLDFCVAIRTIVIVDGQAVVQAAVVVDGDSNPSAACQKIHDEARTLIGVLELAEMGLQASQVVGV